MDDAYWEEVEEREKAKVNAQVEVVIEEIEKLQALTHSHIEKEFIHLAARRRETEEEL